LSHSRAGFSGRPSPEEELFNECWKSHAPRLFRRCLYWLGGNRADAQEAFSRIALKVHRHLPKHFSSAHDDPPALSRWLYRLAYNTCIDVYRERQKRPEELIEPDADLDQLLSGAGALPFVASPPENPEHTLLSKEVHATLLRGVHELPDKLREVVECYVTLDNHRDAASHLHISEENFRKRLQKARALLRAHLEDYLSGRWEPRRAVPPRHPEEALAPGRSGHRDDPWRVYALRPVQLRLDAGREVESLVALHHPPQHSSSRRQEALESYIQAHPTGWKKRLQMGRHLLEEGWPEAALPHYEAVVQRQPRLFLAWLELTMLHRLRERPELAAAVCERALAHVTEEFQRCYLRGVRASCLGQHAEAERAFQAACERLGGSAMPQVALAECCLSTGRPWEATRHLAAALAQDSTNVAALTVGHEALRLAGRSGEARRRAVIALGLDATNLPALLLWSRTSLPAGDTRGPLAMRERQWRSKLKALAQTRADAQRAQSLHAARQGDLTGAERRLTQLVQQRPQLRAGWRELARFLDWRGEETRALAALEQARALGEQGRELDLLECRISTRAGRKEQALSGAEGLLRRYGEAWDTASTTAWVLSALGDTSGRALELSSIAVAHQPHLPVAWLEHGQLLARAGRPAQAVEAFHTAWTLLPPDDGQDIAAPIALGAAESIRRLGAAEESQRWARRALESASALNDSDLARARRWRSQALAALGEAGTGMNMPARHPTDGASQPCVDQLELRWMLRTQPSEPPLG
jgi:RNA polymerase sigma factor (sigma-70 family)